MSSLKVCDICGKDENYTGVAFDEGPIYILKKNFKGENIRVQLFSTVDYEEDFDTKTAIEAQLEKKQFESQEELMKFLNSFKLKCADSMMCNKCKRELLYNLLAVGFFNSDKVEEKTKNPKVSKKVSGYKQLLSEIKKLPDAVKGNSKDYSNLHKYGFVKDDKDNMFFSEKMNPEGFKMLLDKLEELENSAIFNK
jgi:hypothetical protein